MTDVVPSPAELGEAPRGPDDTVAFLLSKLGFVSRAGFAAALAPLGFEPRHAGLLRAVAAHEGRSQQALGQALGFAPSRIVALVDDLEARGLVERHLNPKDRRAREIHLTPAGREAMRAIAEVGLRHEADVCAPLSPDERRTLLQLLRRIAGTMDLPIATHPALAEE
jgi:DNA-binding MarR family transcriptional regulator